MMRRKLYLTPFSYRGLHLTKRAQIALAAGIGFDGIEGGVTGGALDDEELALLREFRMGLVVGKLIRRKDGTADDEQVRRLHEMGVTLVSVQDEGAGRFSLDLSRGFRGLPGIIGTREAALAAAKNVQKDAAFAAQYGFDVYYHNHTVEFRQDKGQYLIDLYLDHAPENVKLELDVCWLAAAGVEPVSFIRGHAEKIGALHIKAYNWTADPELLGFHCPVPVPEYGLTPDHQAAVQAYAEAVQGPMRESPCDWGEIIASAEAAGCSTFIIERERDYQNDIIACLQEDFDWIRACMDR